MDEGEFKVDSEKTKTNNAELDPEIDDTQHASVTKTDDKDQTGGELIGDEDDKESEPMDCSDQTMAEVEAANSGEDELSTTEKQNSQPTNDVDLSRCLETLQYSNETPEGLKVSIYIADITCDDTDVIVNAANSSLQHGGGVAWAIVQTGGEIIQEQSNCIVDTYGHLPVETVCHTTAGNLKSKHVIHAVGPIWREDKRRCKGQLFTLLMKIFTYASRILKAKSLAIPAVGAGLYGIPISICAQIFHRAIIEFSSKREENTILEDIRIVLYDVEATGEFLLEFCNTEPDDTDALGLKIDRSKLDQELSDLEPITIALPDRSTELHDNATYLPGSIHKKSTGRVVLLSTNVKKINPAMDRDKIATSVTAGGICKICSKDKASLKSMNCCKETLCDNCFKNHFKRKGKCPFCTTLVLVIEGLQPPDGKMDFKKESEYDLPGYENAGSIVVDYYFPDGVQEKGHPNPGKPYNGMRLRAYLPANGHGLEVLTLLQKAFDHRLLFKIGTTENENSVVSNDVHHKTNPAGGPANHGYPDSTYLDRVKEELAAKGVQ